MLIIVMAVMAAQETATKELGNLNIDYKKACDELRKEIAKETNKNKSVNEEYER